MSDSHFTCESRSILTRTCRKPASPVAFALHLSIDGSATYSGIGETLCARRSGGSHEAPSHPTCHRRPARRHVHRLLMFRRPHPSITGAGSIRLQSRLRLRHERLERSHRSRRRDDWQFQPAGLPHRRHGRRKFPDRRWRPCHRSRSRRNPILLSSSPACDL